MTQETALKLLRVLKECVEPMRHGVVSLYHLDIAREVIEKAETDIFEAHERKMRFE